MLLFVAGLFFLAGCDSNGSDKSRVGLTREISLDSSGNPILFTFSEANAATGRLQDIGCDCNIDIGPFLTEQGFSKAGIVSASLTAARIVMLLPTSERVNFLETAILKLQTDGLSATEVASQNTFSDSRESTMQTLSNRDVSAFLERTNFEAILQINPASLQSGETYELGLIFTIQLEMETQ
jgi:hypothetical protein